MLQAKRRAQPGVSRASLGLALSLEGGQMSGHGPWPGMGHCWAFDPC